MISEIKQNTSAGYVAKYLQGVLEDRIGAVRTREGEPLQPRGAGHIGPTFWGDAPWRLEPDQDAIPFTFIVWDAAKAKMYLKEIAAYEAPDDWPGAELFG